MPDLFPSLRTKRTPVTGSTALPRPGSRKEILFAGYYPGNQPGGVMGIPGRQVDVDRAVREGYMRVVWVYKAVDTIASCQARLPVQVLSGKNPVEDHPLARLLNGQANPVETGRRFRKRLSQQILLSPKGAFIEVTSSRAGDPIRLDLLPPARTRIVVSTGDPRVFTKPAGEIERYEVQSVAVTGAPTGNVRRVDPATVRWIGEPHPLDPYSCMTPLQAATLSSELSHFARLFNRQFMANDGRPGGILGVKDADENEDEAEMDRVERKFGTGPMEAGRLVVLAGGLDYVDVARTPREGSWGETMDRSKDELLVAFGVPESQIGNASGRTYLNGAVDAVSFWTGTMRNHNDTFLSAFTPDVGPDLTLAFDVSDVDALNTAEQQRRQELREEFSVGLITADYYAQETGRPVMNVPGSRSLWIVGGIPVAANSTDQIAVEKLAPVGTGAAAAPMRGGAAGQPPNGQQPDGTVGGQAGTGDIASARAGQGEPFGITPAMNGAGQKAHPVRPRSRKTGPARRPTPDDDKEDERVRDRAEDALAASLRDIATRQVEVAVARLTGPKARKGTRHWTGGTALATKALDVTYVIDPDRWADEAGTVTDQTLGPLAQGYGERMQDYLAEDDVDTTQEQEGASVPPMPTPGLGHDLHPFALAMLAAARRSAADAARARAERMQERLAAAEEAGGSIEDLVAALRGAAAETPAPDGSGDALALLRGMGEPDAWARSVASTASTTALEGTRQAVLSAAGHTIERTWRTRLDPKVRHTHAAAEGQRALGDERFMIGGFPARFPGDPDLPPGERINCRCSLGYALRAQTQTKALHVSETKAAWDAAKHPRDRHGRFAKIGEVVRVLEGDHAGTVAKIVGTPDAGHVEIATRTGVQTVAAHDVERHTGPAPEGAPADVHHVASKDLVKGDRMLPIGSVVKATMTRNGRTTVMTGKSGYRGQHAAVYDPEHIHVLDRRGPGAKYEEPGHGVQAPSEPRAGMSKGDDPPIPLGLSFVPEPGQTHARCRHGEVLPLNKFPTMTGGKRGTECRAHRDARRRGQGVPPVTETDDRPEHIRAVEAARTAIGDLAFGTVRQHVDQDPMLVELKGKIDLAQSRLDRWQAIKDGAEIPEGYARDTDPDIYIEQEGDTRDRLQAKYDEMRAFLVGHSYKDNETRVQTDLAEGYGPGAQTQAQLAALKRAGEALDAEAMTRAEARLQASEHYVSPEEDQRITEAFYAVKDADYRAIDSGHPENASPAAVQAWNDHSTLLERLAAMEWERKRLRGEAYREVLGEVTDLGGHEHTLQGAEVHAPDHGIPAHNIRTGTYWIVDGVPRLVTAVRSDPFDVEDRDGRKRKMYVTVEGLPLEQQIPYNSAVRIANLDEHGNPKVPGPGPVDPEHEKAVRWAESNYPRGWLQTSGQAGAVTVTGGQRGQYAHSTSPDRPSTLTLSAYGSRVQWPGQGQHDSVAVHELGHRMEHTVPGVQAAEWAYYWSRCGKQGKDGTWEPDDTVPLGGGYRPDEITRPDQWRDRYAGKAYANDGGAPLPQHPYEILTMGVQDLFAGEDYADDDHRRFTLGVIASLSAPRTEPVEPEVKKPAAEPEEPAHVTAVKRARALLPEDRREIGMKGRKRVVDDERAADYQRQIDLYGLPEDQLRKALAKQYKADRGYVPDGAIDDDIADAPNAIARAQESLDARLAELRQNPDYDPTTDTLPAMRYGRPEYDTETVGQYEVPGQKLRGHLDAVHEAGRALVAEINRRMADEGHEERITKAEAAVKDADEEATRLGQEAIDAHREALKTYLAKYDLTPFTMPSVSPHVLANARHNGKLVFAAPSPAARGIYRVRPVDRFGRVEGYSDSQSVDAGDLQMLSDAEQRKVVADIQADWSKIRAGADAAVAESDATQIRIRAAAATERRKAARARLDEAKDAAGRSRRDHTLAVMTEVRQHGAEGSRTLTIARASRPDQEAAVRAAEAYYPTEWLDQAKKRALTVTGAGRGSYGLGMMKLSKGRKGLSDQDEYTRVAVHETGHLMEETVPGLTALEWAYHFSRTHETAKNGSIKRTGENALRQMPGYGRREKARRDKFVEPYTGKVYDDGPAGHWEILTTGTESLYAGSDYIRGDDDLQAFLLGTLAAL